MGTTGSSSTTDLDTPCAFAAASLERFSPERQTKRRLARSKAYETLKAVQAFEHATTTKADPNMLAMLLQRHSTSNVIDANNRALRVAKTSGCSEQATSQIKSNRI